MGRGQVDVKGEVDGKGRGRCERRRLMGRGEVG